MSKRSGIHNIKNSQVRSLARGLLDRKAGPNELKSTFRRLLSAISASDLEALDHALREDRLFSHVSLLPEFPIEDPFKGDVGFSLVPDGELALRYIGIRIAENAGRIANAFNLFSDLNEAILSNSDAMIVTLVEEILRHHGHSLALARKAAVVVGYAPKDTQAYLTCLDLVSNYGVNSRNYGLMATIDSIGVEFNYLDLKARFQGFASLSREATLVRKISQLCFTPLTLNTDQLRSLAAASYEISLLDAAIATLAHRDEGVIQVEVPTEVNEAWVEFSRMPAAAWTYFSNKDPYIDLCAFRTSSAFIEFSPFRHLRLALEGVYNLSNQRLPSQLADGRTAKFFENVERITDIVPNDVLAFEAFPEHFNTETAGTLSRSCAMVWACNRDPDFSGISKVEMASLMGHTFELDRLLAPSVLRTGAAGATDQFVELILQTLLRAHSSATRDSYNFKERFQRYVREHHGGDVLAFMEEVRSLSENVIQYFVALLDETMLSQMAFLMESSDAVYETRARLLEWFAAVANDGVSKDKAKQLRIDRKIAAVRGAINETRLNIDSVRFRQWVEQSKLPEFSDFIRQASPNLPSITELTDSSKASTRYLAAHREPTTRALLALTECYAEFCRNPDFGIASFLGRRIRHGTLRGTLINSLPDVSDTNLPPASLGQYESWVAEFTSSISSLTSRLYFRERNAHRDGLLTAEIESVHQWEVCLICLNAIYDQGQQDHGVLSIPLLIEQYCWLLFESELAKVRAAIGEARTRWGTLKLRQTNGDDSIAAFEKQVNISVGDQFSTVVSWFRKPPNISPIAELSHVIEVVLQEARDEYATFTPEVDVCGAQDLQLSGATYYVAYDALTVAVRNVAKHGLHPGNIRIGATIHDAGTATLLVIKVESRLKGDDDPAAAISRIEDAGRKGAVNADVVEGLSGIRKLHKMVAERSVLTFEAHPSTLDSHSICISISLPFKGIVE